jgi:hypothetical protein
MGFIIVVRFWWFLAATGVDPLDFLHRISIPNPNEKRKDQREHETGFTLPSP